jgi:hypothetical protein
MLGITISAAVGTRYPMKKNEAQTGRLSERATFADVARMIAPFNMPPWLPAHLEWWAQGIRYDRMVDQYRPTTSQTVERLSEVAEAARVLERNLSDLNIRNLLESAGIPNKIKLPIATLKDLADRAETTLSSPILTGKDGKTKRGHGKPTVPHVFDAKTLCAARILELGRFLNKFEPGIKSARAAAAAQAYWLASGGASKSFGNPLNGWKHHFKLAKDNAGSIGLKRLIWWRDLIQCHQRGRPPWSLGTYFPVPEAEIRSANGV